jgi:hypothetical protein
MTQFLLEHWKAILATLIFLQAVNALPAPTDRWPWTKGFAYSFVFGFLHGLANIPRMLATLFPDSKAGQLFLKGGNAGNGASPPAPPSIP